MWSPAIDRQANQEAEDFFGSFGEAPPPPMPVEEGELGVVPPPPPPPSEGAQ